MGRVQNRYSLTFYFVQHLHTLWPLRFVSYWMHGNQWYYYERKVCWSRQTPRPCWKRAFLGLLTVRAPSLIAHALFAWQVVPDWLAAAVGCVWIVCFGFAIGWWERRMRAVFTLEWFLRLVAGT